MNKVRLIATAGNQLIAEEILAAVKQYHIAPTWQVISVGGGGIQAERPSFS